MQIERADQKQQNLFHSEKRLDEIKTLEEMETEHIESWTVYAKMRANTQVLASNTA